MIKKGDKFRCIKTLTDNYIGLWYQKGKIYKSDLDGCITDENNEWWTSQEEILMEYFIPYISNKRGGYGRKERKKV